MKFMTDKTRWCINARVRGYEALRFAACFNLLLIVCLPSQAALSQDRDAVSESKQGTSWKIAVKEPPKIEIKESQQQSDADVTPLVAEVAPTIIEGEPDQLAIEDGPVIPSDTSKADLTLLESELNRQDSAELDNETEVEIEEELISSVNEINVLPVVDLAPELRKSLQRQFELVQKIEEEEDAFSENLGEAYLAYGKLLAQAGRIDEARDMYARALHLVKVNNGVYAIEQRPVLRAMFNIYDAKGQLDEMERYLRQIIWLEKKHPENQDDYSYDLVLRLSNLLIDHYLAWPKITEAALSRINKSIHYLRYAMNRYGDQPLSEVMLPYGELALLHYFKFQISVELNRTFFDQSRYKTMADLDKSSTVLSRSNFVASAQENLDKYLERATKENNVEHQVRALRDLGDLQLLFGRSKDAANYYNLAWLRAADLDENHELVSSFMQPHKLPDFNYAGKRTKLDKNIESVYVPLLINLDEFGKVKKILTKADETPYPRYVFRAKRTSRKLIFRPTIENGAMVKTPNFQYDVRLHLRPKEVARGPELP